MIYVLNLEMLQIGNVLCNKHKRSSSGQHALHANKKSREGCHLKAEVRIIARAAAALKQAKCSEEEKARRWKNFKSWWDSCTYLQTDVHTSYQ